MTVSRRTRAAHSTLICALGISSALAYIPAQATNRTDLGAEGSSIRLRWGLGSYNVPVSFQLTGSGSLGHSRGAIVHYNEYSADQPPSKSPFIAFISCDRNVTNTTLENDIFTMANSSGAVAALLYTTTAEACLINPEYSDPDNFDRILDIYTTVRLSSAKIIETRFREVNRSYYRYNSARLNNSYDTIEPYAAGATDRVGAGYLMATLIANVSDPIDDPPPSPSGDDGGNPSSNTSLAMIILYSVTGCVATLFIIVIITGAIRALRHPERYGPRRLHGGPGSRTGGLSGQSRAAGLGRAVLDSFPLIKFGAGAQNDLPLTCHNGSPPKAVDLESNGSTRTERLSGETGRGAMEKMMAIDSTTGTRSGSHQESSTPELPTDIGENHDYDAHSSHAGEALDPSAIGTETCPICIIDFENGDDLRVLPCEGRHRFHPACVDPWLLELSSSCPICRADFGKLESMVAATAPESLSSSPTPSETTGDGPPLPSPSQPSLPPPPATTDVNITLETQSSGPSHPSRFSRYLLFAQDKRRRNRHNAARVQTAPAVFAPSTNRDVPPSALVSSYPTHSQT